MGTALPPMRVAVRQYRIDLVPVASLPPGPGGKFEEFLSLL